MKEKFDSLIEKALHASIQELTNDVKEIFTSMNGYTRSLWEKFEVEGLHRARKHNHLEGFTDNQGIIKKFSCECEFWNPPRIYCKLGRCNAEEESVLYCATELITAVYEIKPDKGDFVSVAFFNRKKFSVECLLNTKSRVIPIGIDYLSNLPSLIKMFKNYDFAGRSEDFKEFDSNIDSLFYQDVESSHLKEQHYKVTTAIKNALMTTLRYREVDKIMHGLMYSSIMRNHQGYNLIFNPLHARTIFNLVRIKTFEVIDKSEDSIVLRHRRSGVILPKKKSHPLDYQKVFWLKDIYGEVHILKNNLC